MSEVQVRRATDADRSLLRYFHRQLYVAHRERVLAKEIEPLFAYKDLDSALEEDVRALLSNRDAVALIAEIDGEPVGYITGHLEVDRRRVLPRRGIIEDWYVDEARRAHGIGKHLVEAIKTHFRDLGCQVLESATWAANAGAREAHTALGFHELDIRYRMRL